MDNAPIIFYDGYCTLCSRTVQFILKRDKHERFLFASLQGKYAQEALSRHRLPRGASDSFLLLEKGKIYARSTGALRLTRYLSGLWPAAFILLIIPAFFRNLVYDWVAKNRYAWFGKTTSCWLPRPEWTARFLD